MKDAGLSAHTESILAMAENSIRLDGLKGTQLYASKRSEYTGWTAIALRPEDDVLHTAMLAYRLMAFSLIAVLLISLCAVFLISRRLTAPIRALRCGRCSRSPLQRATSPCCCSGGFAVDSPSPRA
jgi:hypothetical protein